MSPHERSIGYIFLLAGELLSKVVSGMKSGTGGIGGYDPERWTALDSLAWQKVEAWDLGGNLDSEIFRMLDEAQGGTAEIKHLKVAG